MKNSITKALLTAIFMSTAAQAQEIADTIYTGGPILTINDGTNSVGAVAVKGGRIIAIGKLVNVNKHKNDHTEVFDLAGRTMLPGFVDSHGHVVLGGLQALSANLLPPPDGPNTDIATIQNTLRKWITENQEIVDQVNLIVGFGYDESQLAEKRPPTRYELDEVSPNVPIILVHQSGHFGVANSKALE
ncbi:MAG: amidohydrolase family protein, partial [Desulfobulbia bacterium]